MVLSRMPGLTSLKVKKNIEIMIAKFIFRIIMIIPILWMRIRMIFFKNVIVDEPQGSLKKDNEYCILVTLVMLISIRVVANDRAGIEAAGTWAPRALGHFLFSK